MPTSISKRSPIPGSSRRCRSPGRRSSQARRCQRDRAAPVAKRADVDRATSRSPPKCWPTSASPAAAARKDIRHLEMSLEGSGLAYEPGDALGVWPRNPPTLVEEVLGELAARWPSPLEWSPKRELTHLRPCITPWREPKKPRRWTRRLRTQLPTTARSRAWSWTGDGASSAGATPVLDRLQPESGRRRSASHRRPCRIPARWRHRAGARHRTFWPRARKATRLPVYIERNERFRLPSDGARDLIMIGPGTGVAPYRGFLQDRIATGASGRNWLLFGNPHSRSDFLYQLEWQRALKQRPVASARPCLLARQRGEDLRAAPPARARPRALRLAARRRAPVCLRRRPRMARDVHATLLEVIADARRQGRGAAPPTT